MDRRNGPIADGKRENAIRSREKSVEPVPPGEAGGDIQNAIRGDPQRRLDVVDRTDLITRTSKSRAECTLPCESFSSM